MFDTLYINTSKLPVTEKEARLLGNKHAFQTKDFDCTLTEVYITDDGELQINEWVYESVPVEERPYPNDPGILGIIGSLRRTNEAIRTIKHHGYVNFYTILNDNDQTWLEFNAKFTDGKLSGIERLTPIDAQ